MAAPPEEPPQPRNPYFSFLPDNRARFEKEVPAGVRKGHGAAKVAGEKWKALPEGHKMVYIDVAAATRAAAAPTAGVVPAADATPTAGTASAAAGGHCHPGAGSLDRHNP